MLVAQNIESLRFAGKLLMSESLTENEHPLRVRTRPVASGFSGSRRTVIGWLRLWNARSDVTSSGSRKVRGDVRWHPWRAAVLPLAAKTRWFV